MFDLVIFNPSDASVNTDLHDTCPRSRFLKHAFRF